MTYGGTVPTIHASYSGFVNGDSAVVADDSAQHVSTTATVFESSWVATRPVLGHRR